MFASWPTTVGKLSPSTPTYATDRWRIYPQVKRQRLLAGPGRDRSQRHPRRRHPRGRIPRPGDRRHYLRPPDRRARRPRSIRTRPSRNPGPAPIHRLALVGRLQPAVHRHDRRRSWRAQRPDHRPARGRERWSHSGQAVRTTGQLRLPSRPGSTQVRDRHPKLGVAPSSSGGVTLWCAPCEGALTRQQRRQEGVEIAHQPGGYTESWVRAHRFP